MATSVNDITFRYDVFLSHSSRDKDEVRKLADRLKSDGLAVWFDEWEVQPGDIIGLKIEEGLQNARTLILAMSANALQSEWVTLERHTILFRDPTNAQRRFVPLRLDNAEIKDTLKQFLYVDWRDRSDQQYRRLLKACRPPVANKPDHEKRPRAIKLFDTLNRTTRVSADGRWWLSASPDNTVSIWDLKLREHRLDFHAESKVLALDIVPNGRRAITACDNGTASIWDLDKRQLVAVLKGHMAPVSAVTLTSTGQRAVTGAADRTVRIWDVDHANWVAILRGHSKDVTAVAITENGRLAISGSADKTLRVWNTTGCLAVLREHTKEICDVAVAPRGLQAVSCSRDCTIRIWDLAAMKCMATFEGHTADVTSIAIAANGRWLASGSLDATVRLWDLTQAKCVATFTAHEPIQRVGLTADGAKVIFGTENGSVWRWDPTPDEEYDAELNTNRYSNAKVVVAGESGVGKTGLALRLCENRWEPTESTHGMRIYQLKLPPDSSTLQLEREVWLWDFAGQPDYRLVHQLYMDETALALLVFDPQDDNPFEDLGHWDKAVSVATKYGAAKLLVGARYDRGGITLSDSLFEHFTAQRNIAGLFTTSAKTGQGCEELKAAIAKHIPWDRLPWIATTREFKVLKDAIIKLKEKNISLVRLSELRQRLQLLLSEEIITPEALRAVVGLLQGQGVVQVLEFGEFVLLKPEQINRYASVVVKMARQHVEEMGIVVEQEVLDGLLDFEREERLEEADEHILLRAMVQTLLDRSLCLREQTAIGTLLVFPSYFRRSKPDLVEHPNVFVTYGFSGFMEEIYTTLVVRLICGGVFSKDQLWKNAADFRSPAGKRIGLAMKRKSEGTGEIQVYFEQGVPDDTKVTFIKYVHEHLLQRAENVTRVRTYVCPHCDIVLENRRAIQLRLEKGLNDIICAHCEERVPLLDLIEEKFVSSEFESKVRLLDEQANINLDKESQELIVTGHAFAVSAEAGQVFRKSVTINRIDGEIEFLDDRGQPSGRKVYLRFKGDDIAISVREDGKEIVTVQNALFFGDQKTIEFPVMLVIRTTQGTIKWMNVSQVIAYDQIEPEFVFEGEPFTALNLIKMRSMVLSKNFIDATG